MLDDFAILADPFDGQLALAGDKEIGRLVLVAEGMAADHERVGPAGDDPRHILDDDRLTEYDAAEDVADGAVRRLPHLLEDELLDPLLVRSDGRAFDADATLHDRLARLHGDEVL